MSGIINSAGSRSGVISITELDVEEGEWTATLTGASSAPSSAVTTTGQYYKIGKRVSVKYNFANVDTTGASGTMKVTGLPFTVQSGPQFDGGYQWYAIDFDPDYIINMVAETDYLYWIMSRDNTTWSTQGITAGGGRYIYGSISYIEA